MPRPYMGWSESPQCPKGHSPRPDANGRGRKGSAEKGKQPEAVPLQELCPQTLGWDADLPNRGLRRKGKNTRKISALRRALQRLSFANRPRWMEIGGSLSPRPLRPRGGGSGKRSLLRIHASESRKISLRRGPLRKRNRKEEMRALPRRALHPHPPSMGFYQMLDDRQAQA